MPLEISLTPSFSWVALETRGAINRFNGLSGNNRTRKRLKPFFTARTPNTTQLKLGVNEMKKSVSAITHERMR